MLVDACIARVRAAAHLDDDPVLPAMSAATEDPDVIVLETGQYRALSPSAILSENAAASAHEACAADHATARREPGREAQAAPVRRTRWPLFLCAFIASGAASASLLASPLGQRPAVREAATAVRAVQSGATAAAHDLATALASL